MANAVNTPCEFCLVLNQPGQHHTIPTAPEIQQLESKVLELQRRADDIELNPPNEGDSVAGHHARRTHARQKYAVLSWKLERAKELQRKGLGAPFDLWIDHLSYTEMVTEMWSYESLRRQIPAEFIHDSEIPTTRARKRREFPSGARQNGDIQAATEGGFDEFVMDAEDDMAQHAVLDMYRIRHMSPMLGLKDDDEDDEDDKEDGDTMEEEEDRPIGDNLGLASANAAIKHYKNVLIPQTVRLWKDNAKPYTDRDSKIEMKDYLSKVETFTSIGKFCEPSTQAYRAIAHIAFSLDSAHRLWRKHRITDAAYSKLSRDGMQQIASMRDTLDKAGVIGLPPRLDISPKLKPVQQKPIKPLVINRYMDAMDPQLSKLFTYDPARPLGPMISENAQTEMQDLDGPVKAARATAAGSGLAAATTAGVRGASGRANTANVSREEFTSKTLELDQLVE